jgi:hypothetical protein
VTDTETSIAERVNFSLEFEPSPDLQPDETLQLARDRGAEAGLEQGRDLLVLIAGAMALVALINLVIDLQRRLTRHGIIVNAFDPRNIEVKEDPNLEYGVIVTVDSSGHTSEFDQRQTPAGVETILKSLTSGG